MGDQTHADGHERDRVELARLTRSFSDAMLDLVDAHHAAKHAETGDS
jgi:hypothetical protein